MILPATTASLLFLCLLVFLTLGSWILPWRLGAGRLRFEIFAIDFALGGFLVSLIAAFTLGSMGSELAFTDSLLVSGHRALASVLAAGLIVGMANVALIASASLGGIGPAFLISGATVALVSAWISGLSHPTHLTVGTILAVGTIILAATVSRFSRPPAPPAKSKTTPKPVQVAGPGLTSLLFALLSGLALAGAAELARYGTSGELGVAPYAAFVFISLPAFLATISVTFFLFNFPLQGPRLHANSYFGTRIVQHAAGAVAGVVWGAGILGCFLIRSAPGEGTMAREFGLYSAFGSFVLATAWGLALGTQFERLRARRGTVVGATIALAGAVYFLGYAIAN